MSATNTIKGVVDSVRTMIRKTKFGDKNIHLVTVDGTEFETGFKQVFSQGEMITAGVEHKYGGWQYVDASGNLPPVTAAVTTSVQSTSGGGKGRNGAFPVDPKDGQISIIRQNSLNRAVEILETWGQHGIFKATSEDEYLKKLLEVALIVTDFNSGQHIVELAKAQAANLEVVNG